MKGRLLLFLGGVVVSTFTCGSLAPDVTNSVTAMVADAPVCIDCHLFKHIRCGEQWMFAAGVRKPGGGEPKAAEKIKDVAVWAFHGADDDLVPVSATREMIAALKNAGANPRYTELVGKGHVIWDPIYDDA